jgi:hypothetical protein
VFNPSAAPLPPPKPAIAARRAGGEEKNHQVRAGDSPAGGLIKP